MISPSMNPIGTIVLHLLIHLYVAYSQISRNFVDQTRESGGSGEEAFPTNHKTQ